MGTEYLVEGVGIGLFAATILNEERKVRIPAADICREDQITRVPMKIYRMIMFSSEHRTSDTLDLT